MSIQPLQPFSSFQTGQGKRRIVQVVMEAQEQEHIQLQEPAPLSLPRPLSFVSQRVIPLLLGFLIKHIENLSSLSP